MLYRKLVNCTKNGIVHGGKEFCALILMSNRMCELRTSQWHNS